MVRFLLKAVVSGVLVWLLLRHLELDALLHHLLAADRSYLLLAALCYWSIGLPAAWRWSMVLDIMGHPLRFRVTFPIVLIGYFFSLTLPTAIGGDAMRAWRANRAGVPPAIAIASVVIDRLSQAAAHLLLIALALPFFGMLADRRAAIAVAALLVLGVLGFAAAMMLDQFPYAQRWRPFHAVAEHAAALRQTLLVPRRAVPVLLLGLANQAGVVVVTALLARALHLPVGLLQCFVVVPAPLLLTALPVSIAGWGVREAGFVVGFGLIGVPAADALALSLLLGLVQLAVRLPGGLVWLASSGRRTALS